MSSVAGRSAEFLASFMGTTLQAGAVVSAGLRPGNSVMRLRMNVERHRQSETAEQRQRSRRQLQPEVLAREQAHVQLRNATFGVQSLEETLRAAQMRQGLQQYTLHRHARG